MNVHLALTSLRLITGVSISASVAIALILDSPPLSDDWEMLVRPQMMGIYNQDILIDTMVPGERGCVEAHEKQPSAYM